jgi:hypothetical protein
MTAPIYFLSQISVSIDLNSEKLQNTSFQNGFKFPASTREENLKKSSNQKQELPVAAMFVNESEQNEHSL